MTDPRTRTQPASQLMVLALDDVRRLNTTSGRIRPVALDAGSEAATFGLMAWWEADQLAEGYLALFRPLGPDPTQVRIHMSVVALVARSFWEGAQLVHWIAQDPVSRVPRVKAKGAREYMKLVRHLGQNEDSPELAAIRESASSAAENPPRIIEMATEVGELDAYHQMYAPLSWSAHWGFTSLIRHLGEGGTIGDAEANMAVAPAYYRAIVGKCAELVGVGDAASLAKFELQMESELQRRLDQRSLGPQT